MRAVIKHLMEICAENLPILEPIYEFGSLQVPGQEEIANLRPLFPGMEYVGADMRYGTGVDVILDLHQIGISSESVSTVLILDTIEHVEFPRKAIEEVHRILKPNGILVMGSVMNFRIHGHPYDYWRFTPEGFKSLLRPFTSSFVDFAGREDFPRTVIGIAFKEKVQEKVLDDFMVKLEHWKEYWSNQPVVKAPSQSMPLLIGGWRGIVKLFAPPVIFTIYRKFRG